MSEDKQIKTAKVKSIRKLKSGDEFQVHDFQISASDANGDITMVDFEFEVKDSDEYDTSYEIKPGIWLVHPKSGLSKVDNLKTGQFFETDTSRSLLEHMNKFEERIWVYKKLKQKNIKRSILLASGPGCHAAGQEVIMFDGTLKKVEDIVVGDLLMGPDSKPRKVLSLIRGKEEMVKIIPRKGKSFIVNKNHIQSFVHSGKDNGNAIVNIPISSMIKNDFDKTGKLDRYKLYRSECINFPNQNNNLPIPPYILGMWLGDGHIYSPGLTTMDDELRDAWVNYGNSLNMKCRVSTSGRYVNGEYIESKAKSYYLKSNLNQSITCENVLINKFKSIGLNIGRNFNEKHIPQIYLTATKQERLELLAGLIDTDGHKSSGGVIDFITKFEKLADDIAFLCRGLGFSAYVKKCQKCATNTINKTLKTYYRISISGSLEELPTNLKRKQFTPRMQIKNHLRTGYKTELLPEDNYYGFTVNGDHLYLLSDFTVTHNCGKSVTIRHFLSQNKDRTDICGLIIESGEANWELLTKMFSRVNTEESPVKLVVLVIEDIGGTELNERGSNVGSDMLNFLAGNSEAFKIPTLVIGTTNFINELGETLIDRPGRFDMLINVEPPKDSEVRLLIEPLLERELTKPEEKALFGKGFTPAYCTEIVVRSMLYDISIAESAQQLEKQRENSQKKKHGKKSRSVGFDIDDDDD